MSLRVLENVLAPFSGGKFENKKIKLKTGAVRFLCTGGDEKHVLLLLFLDVFFFFFYLKPQYTRVIRKYVPCFEAE